MQPLLARSILGIFFVAAAIMLAVGSLQQIINVNYTDLGGRTVTGTQIGLLYTCVPSDVSDTLKDNNDSGKLGSFFKVTTGGRELTCWNNWAFDQSIDNRLYRAARNLTNFFTGTNKVNYSTIRAMEWTAIAFFMLSAVLAFFGALFNFIKRTSRWAVWVVSFALLFAAIAFGMGAYTSTYRARISAASALYLAVASLGNKTYSPAVGAFLLIFGLLVLIGCVVTVMVFRNRSDDETVDEEKVSDHSWRSDRTEHYTATWSTANTRQPPRMPSPPRPAATPSEIYEPPAKSLNGWPASQSANVTLNNTPVNTPPGSRPTSRAPMYPSTYASRPAAANGQSFWQKTFGRQ